MRIEESQPCDPDDPTARPALVVLSGHTAPVIGAAFSPDGKLLATTGRDGQIILWETDTGAVRRLWQLNTVSYWVAFTPNGESVVSSEEGLSFWNVESGRWEGRIPNATGPMVFSPDGRHLAAMRDESFLLLESSSGQVIRQVPLDAKLYVHPPAVAISSDGTTGAVATWDERGHQLRVWDLLSGEPKLQRRIPPTVWVRQRDPDSGKLRRTHGAQVDVAGLALSPRGHLLAVGGSFTLWLCNVRTGRRSHLLLCGYDGPRSLAFSPDGKLLAAGTSGGSVMLWRVPSGKPTFSRRGHQSWVSAVAFSPKGELLASGSHDKSVDAWRIDTGECLHSFFASLPYEASGVTYSPDGDRIAVSYSDGSVRIWNARTGTLERLIVTQAPRRGSLCFSSDGLVLASGTRPTDPAWSVATGEVLRPASTNPEEAPPECGRACEALTPDGQMLARSCGWEGVIELLRRDNGELIRTLSDPEEPDGVVSLAFSPDGKRLASGYLGFRVRLWDVETGERLQLMRTHEDSISSLAFSPDGGLLAVGGDYGTVVVLCNLRTETRPVRVVLTREERQHGEGMAGFFDIPPEELPGEEVSLEGHTQGIRGVCFSPDGSKVATVAGDATLKVWDVTSGQLLVTLLPLPGPKDRPSEDWIAYTPDGYYLSSPGATNAIRWRVGDEMQRAEAYASTYSSPATLAGRLR